MGKSATVIDCDIEAAQAACPALGASPPHKRRFYTPRSEMSYREIAAVLGCSRQAVANIEKSALLKLAMLMQ